ncbi:MAG TPA: sugar phosphate isomerase/epimerase [Pirellulales bacterium]|jgi:D-psicose/D-tagatose/L-ribulose 3-epimerase|nr:sugar phosphate isomerase/epimerase [Pirellulales bacterium]
MKFGMNMLLWSGELSDALLPVFEQLKKIGFDGVELPIFDADPAKYALWGKRLSEIGLERTCVTCRTAADNPISPDAKIRAAAVDAMQRVFECCQASDAKLLCGPYHSAIGEFSGHGPTRDEWAWGVEVMRTNAENAAKHGIMLGVEYLNRFECYLLNTAADTVRFVREVDHPNCRMMYDTFHANIEEKDVAEAIRHCAPYIVHVHISENDRSTPGRGAINWDTTFKTLRETGYDGWMTIEAFGLALPELAAATKIWRRMFDSEEQLARDGLAFIKQHVRA